MEKKSVSNGYEKTLVTEREQQVRYLMKMFPNTQSYVS